MNLLSYLTDPVLRAPTIASVLMCFSASLIGCVVFLRRQSLIGESLSHAAYPGVVLGVALAGTLGLGFDNIFSMYVSILGGGALFALLGLLALI